ncbi:MAG: hypothetical protein RR193_04970, partial [Christensenellaceae bacterium]
MSESKISYGLTEDGKLVAIPEVGLSKSLEFIDNSWRPITGCVGDVWRANLISDEDALSITSGV